MAEPVDAIRAFHNAFRKDLEHIDAAAFNAAKGKEGFDATLGRYRFFNEILFWHADGEEKAVFPAIETVAPLVAEAYLRDHRGLDAAYEELDRSYAARDPLKTARATAAFRFHLNIHLAKEDAHLYRIFRERISLPDQGKALGIMAGTIPQERFAEVVSWLYPLIGDDDRENMTRIWQMMMPAPVFAGTKELIKKAIPDDWAELTRRIPALQ
jgi:hemerythrin-like domain-containing protein